MITFTAVLCHATRSGLNPAFMPSSSMERISEPEIMDDRAGAAAYARADFSESNQWFVDRLVADFPERLGKIVDLGCGPADVPIRLARAMPDSHITAVDGSLEMLKLA